MEEQGVGFAKIGYSVPESRTIVVKADDKELTFDIDALRDVWYKTSYLLDRKQSFNGKAKERFENYKKQPLEMKFNKDFTGTLAQYGISAPSSVRRVLMVSVRWPTASTSLAST